MEWKKVWKNKKIVAILIALFCFQMLFFFYNANRTHEKWEQVYGESYVKYHQQTEVAYIESFHDTITAVIKQADNMSGISIFAQEDSFSSHNVEKTKDDYKVLLSVKPVLFDNLFLFDFFADTTRNLVGVIAIAMISFVYIDENKPGLRCMIFATPNGRGRLVLQKIMALWLWALFFALLFGGGNLFASCLYHGKNLADYISYPIQSLSMFGNLPWNINIGGFLLVYLVYQSLVLFLIGLGIWTILFCVEYLLLSIGIIGAIGIATYFLYKLIDAKHPLNILHYCNPWYLTNGSSIFMEYKNLNFAEQAINKNLVILLFLLFMMFLFGAIVFAVGILRYPCSSTIGNIKRKVKNMEIKIQRTIDTWVSRLSLTGMEYYKVLIGQKGIVVIITIVILFFYQADFTDIQLSERQEMYFTFMEKHEGLPDEASEQEIDDLTALMAQIEADYFRCNEAYENGEITSDQRFLYVTRYLNSEQERQFLQEIQRQRTHIHTLKQERGISAWYINCYSYNKLLREGSLFVNFLLLFGTLLLTSGVFVSEKESGMLHTLHSSLLGREDLLRKKFSVAYILTMCLFVLVALLEFGTVGVAYGFSGWNAPVQSIIQLGTFPIPCSIWAFFLGLYILKAGVLLAVTTAYGSMLTRVIS